MRNLVMVFRFWFITMGIACLLACSDKLDSPHSKTYPLADGTFIQDYFVAQWDDSRWQQELSVLKEAGMHYLILAPTLSTEADGINRIVYPGSLPNVVVKYSNDIVDACLRNAKKAGIKVFLGLNFNEKWWNADISADWLNDQMRLGNQLADDLTKRYKGRYGDTMYGWYWVWEVDNLNWKTASKQEMLSQALNINLDHLSEITPRMPFMLCPFVNYQVGGSAENCIMWQNVFSKTHFRKGDIFAPQDCVGAGGLKLDMVDKWFSDMNMAVKSKPGLLFWSDAETFDQRFWTAAPLDRFVKQMEVVKPYVSNIITFAYSHYYSPSVISGGFHNTYLEYVKSGILPRGASPDAVSNLFVSADQEKAVTLRWKEPNIKSRVAGYYIYRDGELIGNLQYGNNGQMLDRFQDRNLDLTKTYQYEVRSYSFSGVESAPATVTWKKN